MIREEYGRAIHSTNLDDDYGDYTCYGKDNTATTITVANGNKPLIDYDL